MKLSMREKILSAVLIVIGLGYVGVNLILIPSFTAKAEAKQALAAAEQQQLSINLYLTQLADIDKKVEEALELEASYTFFYGSNSPLTDIIMDRTIVSVAHAEGVSLQAIAIGEKTNYESENYQPTSLILRYYDCNVTFTATAEKAVNMVSQLQNMGKSIFITDLTLVEDESNLNTKSTGVYNGTMVIRFYCLEDI